MRRTRHAWAVAACTVAAVVVLPLAAAWACTSLATLNVTPTAGASGQTVTGVGNGFGRVTSGNSPVEIRWNSSTGPLMATVVPASTGTISFSFIAPAGEAGYYTVIASQKTSTGAPVGGTPARATFALNSPAAQAINGAGGATTVDQQASIDAPPAVAFAAPTPVTEQAPAAQPAVAAAAPAPASQSAAAAPAQAAAAPPAPPAARPITVAPAQPLAPIAPSDARSRDVLAPGGVDSFLGGPGLVMVLFGAVALSVAAVAAVVAPKRSTARVARRTR